MQDVLCFVCKKLFKRKRSQVLLAEKHYCSVGCQNIGKRRGKIITCFICGKKVYKKNKDLISSRSTNYFCSIACSNQWLGTQRQAENHPNWVHGKSSYRNILKRISILKICKLCDEADDRILIVHHIDKDRTNNTIKNLVWLCHNCHFLVHHDIEAAKELTIKIAKYANS